MDTTKNFLTPLGNHETITALQTNIKIQVSF